MNARVLRPSDGPYFPLHGLRVIECCWIWSGPFVGQFLADLGAEVIKLEWYKRFDPYRTRGVEQLRGKVSEKRRQDMSPSFHSLNRNKVGLTVDLKHPEGVDLVKRLAAKSDMVIENWTAGTLDRLGLGFDALSAENPSLVMMSLGAFGPHSRLRDMRSYGLVTSSMGGLERNLEVDGEFVGSPAFVISDPNAALFGLLGCLASVVHAKSTGQGLNLDVSQLEASLTLAAPIPGLAEPPPEGVFETQDGGYVAVSYPAGWNTEQTERFCKARATNDVVAKIRELGSNAAALLNVIDTPDADIFSDLEVRVSAEHPVTGREDVIAAPWRVNGRRAPLRKTAPQLAEGNTYVLGTLLGLTDEEIAGLKERNVI